MLKKSKKFKKEVFSKENGDCLWEKPPGGCGKQRVRTTPTLNVANFCLFNFRVYTN